MMKFNYIPVKNRSIEKYIDPNKPYWESRYYEVLFDLTITDEYKKIICINYLEGLEWCWKYYVNDCVDWRWSYKYHYPPLLSDLVKYIPDWKTTFIGKNNNQPVNTTVQLSYVLPKDCLSFLNTKVFLKLMKDKIKNYDDNCEIHWSFCKYFWESHPCLPEVDLNELEEYVMGL